MDYVWTPLRQHPVHEISRYLVCTRWWSTHDRYACIHEYGLTGCWRRHRLLPPSPVNTTHAGRVHQTVCKRLSLWVGVLYSCEQLNTASGWDSSLDLKVCSLRRAISFLSYTFMLQVIFWRGRLLFYFFDGRLKQNAEILIAKAALTLCVLSTVDAFNNCDNEIAPKAPCLY